MIEPQQDRVVGCRSRTHRKPARRIGDPGANHSRRFRAGEFVAHLRWYEYVFKKLWDKIDMPDPNKIVERRCVGHDNAHAGLQPEAAHIPPFLFQIFNRVIFEHAMGLEEAVQASAGFKAEQASEFGLGDMPALEFFERQHFQNPAR